MKRSIFDSNLGKTIDAQIIQRHKLNEGEKIIGPAIISEDETTIILTSNFTATLQSDKSIRVSTTK